MQMQQIHTLIPVAKPCPAFAWIPLATSKTWRLLKAAAYLNCHSSECLLSRILAVKDLNSLYPNGLSLASDTIAMY